MGAFKSIPITLLNWELDISPISFRLETLAMNYLISLNSRPFSLMYGTASSVLYKQTRWKPRSTPAILPICSILNSIIDLNIFNNNSSSARNLPPPPWMSTHIDFLKFPLNKKEAASNHSLARSLFMELFEQQLSDTINISTDGALRDNIAACAFTVPQLDIDRAWKLSSCSSIFSAELLAIKKALEFVYNLDFSVVNIFTDSLASALAICNHRFESNTFIVDIHRVITNLLSAGTCTKFI